MKKTALYIMTIIGATLMITSNAQPIDDIKANTIPFKRKYVYQIGVIIDPFTGEDSITLYDSIPENLFFIE